MLLYTKFGAMVPSGLASATRRRNWASRAQLGRNRGLLRSDDARRSPEAEEIFGRRFFSSFVTAILGSFRPRI